MRPRATPHDGVVTCAFGPRHLARASLARTVASLIPWPVLRPAVPLASNRVRRALLSVVVLGSAVPVAAQDDGDLDFPPSERPADAEPRYEALRDLFGTEALRLGLLVQAVADVQAEEAPERDVFRLGAARLAVSGRLDRGFGYKLQAEFADGVSLKDARVSAALVPGLTLDAGRFKTPVSLESLTSTSETDFVGRSRVVEALVPGRRVGAALTARPGSGLFVLRGALLNGASDGPDAPAAPLLAAGRIGFRPRGLQDVLHLGANLAYDGGADALLVGADARAVVGRWLLSTEALASRADSTTGPGRTSGFYATVGYSPSDHHQVLVRIDHLDPGTVAASDLLVLGYTLTPSRPVRVEVNLRVPLTAVPMGASPPAVEAAEHRLLVNLQLAF